MAINQNHLFEEIDGVRCSIVEKNCKPARVEFLKSLLELNGYTVVIKETPPPKTAPPTAAATATATSETPPPPPPATFIVYVTDNVFNVANAIMGRLLKTKDGHVVTMKYWKQMEEKSRDEIPYFAKKWR